MIVGMASNVIIATAIVARIAEISRTRYVLKPIPRCAVVLRLLAKCK